MCMKHNIFMCEECLQCRDPDIYCKFRSSCPIWFMEKRGGNQIDDISSAREKRQYTVLIQPENKKVTVAEGTTLLEAAVAADIPLNASCNGKGVCGKCKLVVEKGTIDKQDTSLLTREEKENNYVLACRSLIKGDIVVRIPEETREKKLKVAGMGKAATAKLKGIITSISPMISHIPLELAPPTIDDVVSDLDRLIRELSKNGLNTGCMNVGLNVMQELACVMRDKNWKITASVIQEKCSSEILRVVPGNGEKTSLGIAVDIGTTSIVVYLVDMSDGTIAAATSGHNRQAACGDDVINRIVCAEKDGVEKLRKMGLSTINGLINEAISGAGVHRMDIDNVVLSGNTTMTHLLLGIDPRYIRREPYIPAVSVFPVIRASEIGLNVGNDAAVFIMPGPAGYVGGDIVSGLLFAGFHREDPISLFIDVGTNGEIVLGNKDWLMTASCSAGPAFEGGGIRWGMRAEEGAIEKITIDPDTRVPDYSVVGDVPPRGICGSGMIDLIAEMLSTGIIHPNGKFSMDPSHPVMTEINDEIGYIVAPAEKTSVEKDIIFTESDVSNIIRSKGAIYAGIKILLNQADLECSDVDRVIISGGFGQFLNIEKAVMIGLLPDIDREKFSYIGNSSIGGAYMALLSENHRQEAIEVSNKMTYIDFSSNNKFMEEFTSALFLPHTNIEDFPSVKVKRR